MVFTRPPADSAPPPAPRKKPHTKKPRNKRERAAADAAAFLALSPEEKIAHEQKRQRMIAEENAIREQRQAERNAWEKESQERRRIEAAEEAKRAAEQAELERRAGIQWPGSITSPAWITAYEAAHPKEATATSESFETQFNRLIDDSILPMFGTSNKDEGPLVAGIVTGAKTAKELPRQCQREMVDAIRTLVESPFETAVESVPCEVIDGKEMIPAGVLTPTAMWAVLAKGRTISDFLRALRGIYFTAFGDGPLCKDDLIRDLKFSAYFEQAESMDLMAMFEDADTRLQDDFISELVSCGALSRHDVTA
jgi:hypothetical protein